MSGNWPIDHGFDRLGVNEAVVQGAVGSNEDTTRMRAIDTVLFDVLGWDKNTVETEKHCRLKGFADYAFQRDSAIPLVLEAKRIGETFLLPNRVYANRPYSFNLIAQECPEAEAALIQAVGYATQFGSKYVAISNGHQWILALSYVANQPLRERSVFVFESFDAIKRRFDQFWKCFSPEGIYSNTPAAELLESRKAPPPAKLAADIHNYPAPADRNVIINELSVVLKILWEDVNRQEDRHFLEECYVIPEFSEDTLAVAKEMLEYRRHTDELESSEALDAQHVPNLMADYNPEKPIVVLGRIGHGKSTFLKYLRLIKAQQVLKRYIQLQNDFIHRPGSRDEVGAYCYGQIESQLLALKDQIDIMKDGFARSVLAYDLRRYKESSEAQLYPQDSHEYKVAEVAHIKSLQSDRHAYLAKVFRHLKKGRNYSIAIFFDNVDRRLDPIQEEAFLKASAMARDWGCLVFVCLRPSTFYRSKEEGVLDSLAPKTIGISPPKVSAVLRRRFKYARRMAAGETIDGKLGPAASLGVTFSMDLPRVERFLQSCEESFGRNKKLISLFEAAANGNIRDLLRLVGDVLTSSHFNTKKILEMLDEQDDSYVISDHEAQRALLFVDSFHYDPTRSIFINLFDISHADPMEHFSMLLTLSYLSRIGHGPPNRGYCAMQNVVQYLCQIGYSEAHAKRTIETLYGKKYCEPRIPGLAWSTVEDGDIRVTNIGRYHVGSLVKTFQYVDAVVVDTPVLNDKARRSIKDEFGIFERINRSRVFLDYLDECSQSLQDADAGRLWNGIYTEIKQDIESVQVRARRSLNDA